jgi:hypothetical protein
MFVNSSMAELLAASQEGLSSLELVILRCFLVFLLNIRDKL